MSRVDSVGPQKLSLHRTAPAALFHKDSIRTPKAEELKEAERRLRKEKAEFMARPITPLAPLSSTMGDALGVGFGPRSPSLSISTSARFGTTTAVPRGLMAKDSRPNTDFSATMPDAMHFHPSSRVKNPRSHKFGSVDRLFPGVPMSPIKGGDRRLLASPHPVSSSLYDPAKIERRRKLAAAGAGLPEPAGLTLSSMGPQTTSQRKSQPNTVIGTCPRTPGFVVTETTTGPYSGVDKALEATRPRVRTARCNGSGRPDASRKKVPGVDWDFAPAGVPAAGSYNYSLGPVKPKSPSFSMGAPPPKEKRERNGRVDSSKLFRF